MTVDIGTGNAVLKTPSSERHQRNLAAEQRQHADQPTPALLTRPFRRADGRIVVTGGVAAYPDYHGRYQMQVFFSPLGDAPNVQAGRFLGSQTDVAAGDFGVTVPGCRDGRQLRHRHGHPCHGAADTLGTVNPASIGT